MTGSGDKATPRGWVLYDGKCHHCVAAAKRSERFLERRGFIFLPLQTPWVQERLHLHPSAPLKEMRVLTADGTDMGGPDAIIFLARHVWWAWPFYVLVKLPGMRRAVDQAYRWVATHRGCAHSICDLDS